jgi:hypothetical protein
MKNQTIKLSVTDKRGAHNCPRRQGAPISLKGPSSSLHPQNHETLTLPYKYMNEEGRILVLRKKGGQEHGGQVHHVVGGRGKPPLPHSAVIHSRGECYTGGCPVLDSGGLS